ncbi:Tetratricopeptide repeat protein 30A [Phytophthora pseudosyringae]|uniref:Tetratricopeptide repeat protein 30A n=1 Tax=Phytophthora pseudosyringae TaxID=221518 RepID=A0A8T1V8J9_9STRA|nr:Tetratricopeptide repeat protein 30A [Phytophthora pseudosyringae]
MRSTTTLRSVSGDQVRWCRYRQAFKQPGDEAGGVDPSQQRGEISAVKKELPPKQNKRFAVADVGIRVRYAASSIKNRHCTTAVWVRAGDDRKDQPDLSYNIALCFFKMKQYANAMGQIDEIIEKGVRDHPGLSVGSKSEQNADVKSVPNSTVLREMAQ